MKKIVGAFLLAATLFSASAESKWLSSFPDAKQQAQKENKAILLDFTGSDWCPACIQLRKTVFNTEEFGKFADQKLVLVEVDFPRTKKLSAEQQKANDNLAEKYNIEAYPTIILVDSNGKKLKEWVGYDGESPSEYAAKLDKVIAKAHKKKQK